MHPVSGRRVGPGGAHPATTTPCGHRTVGVNPGSACWTTKPAHRALPVITDTRAFQHRFVATFSDSGSGYVHWISSPEVGELSGIPPAKSDATRGINVPAAHLKAQDKVLASGKKLADQEKFKREEHPFDAYPRLKQQALTNAPPSLL